MNPKWPSTPASWRVGGFLSPTGQPHDAEPENINLMIGEAALASKKHTSQDWELFLQSFCKGTQEVPNSFLVFVDKGTQEVPNPCDVC